jgi:hypothetical protein
MDGGQRGSPPPPEIQALSKPNGETTTLDAIEVSQQLPNNLERAVAWLFANLDGCPRPIVPYIKQAYNLTSLDACEALRLARLKSGTGAE